MEKEMSKTKLLRVVNPLLGIAILNQAVTALSHKLLSPNLFDTMHIGGGITLLVLVAIHLTLNWSWVKSNYRINKSGR